ncbi:MAG TPA: serine hydrolase [Gemmatimonadaceae bacterium]|nr:serine hydrolase [Gemmatimonadaceae bacterium]
MTRSTAVLTALLLTLATTRASAQYRLPADDTVKAILAEQVGPKRTAGVVVGLMEADGKVRVLSAGKADNGTLALDEHVVFEIGSITKTFTNAILADMVRKGEVSLDDPVQKFLPATVKIPTRNGKEITLLDLATASSGLPGMPNNFRPKDPGNPYADYSVDQMYEFLNGYTLTRDIGSRYEYSNLGMGLLGHALALRAGKSYADLVTERVLAPLGMTDTRIELTADMKRRLALGHNPAGAVVPNWDIPTLAGAGALRSTVRDMLKYLAANLDSTSTPLGPTLAMTHVSRRPTTSPAMTMGMGWHILKLAGGSVVWHNGGTGGYRTFTGFDPVKRVGVVVLSNSAISVDDIGFHLIDPSFPRAKPPVQRAEITVDAALLARYEGTYELNPQLQLTVTVENGALMITPTQQPKYRARAYAEKDFFIPEVPAEVSFVLGEDGKATQLVLRQGGGAMVAKRVK